MKKRLRVLLLVGLLGAAVCGCGVQEPETYATLQAEPIVSSQVEELPAETEKPTETEIYSHEQLSPAEDAKVTLESYQESFDYYNQLISEAGTTIEMVEYSGRLYELSDECLNYLWNLIRNNVDEEKYREILAEQREWIQEKEAAANAARDELEGGSLAPVAYNNTLATKTIERCQELAEYLK